MVARYGAGPVAAPSNFGTPVPVTNEGYHGDAMEPFVSTDGKYLFFNNRNDPATSTDLYFARRVNDTTFAFAGALAGANSPELDAVASMDRAEEAHHVDRFVEAPALSPDGQAIYFHERVGDTFRIFRAPRR